MNKAKMVTEKKGLTRMINILLFFSIFFSIFFMHNIHYGYSQDIKMVHSILANYGICYGPFRDGQNPDVEYFPTVEEIKDDLRQLKSITNEIRLYSSTGIWFDIAKEAKLMDFTVIGGIWLSKDINLNNTEILSAIDLAKKGYIKSLIVGSETQLRGDISEVELINYINTIRKEIPDNISLTTAEPWSIYLQKKELRNQVDFFLVHIYPFWEGVSIEDASKYLLEKYLELKKIEKDKEIIIGETGWPSNGTSDQAGVPKNVVPSYENQYKYLNDLITIAKDNNIKFFWFSAYDEEWKWKEGIRSGELSEKGTILNYNLNGGFPGSSWGIFTSDGIVKPLFENLIPSNTIEGTRRIRVIYDRRGLSSMYDMGVDSSSGIRNWLNTTQDGMQMVYPSNQIWGAVFITIGKVKKPPHPFKNFSSFNTLCVDLRGENGGEFLEIGIKDKDDPDDGSEKKIIVKDIPKTWTTYNFPLNYFTNADLKKLYVVIEFVFSGNKQKTVFFQNVKYIP